MALTATTTSPPSPAPSWSFVAVVSTAAAGDIVERSAAIAASAVHAAVASARDVVAAGMTAAIPRK